MRKAPLTVMIVVLASPLASVATTYYVRQTVGDDASDGMSPKTAWQHLWKLSSAMQAGDTAYVGPGLYREEIHVRTGGTAENRVTLIADATGQQTADPPGMAAITGADAVDEGIFAEQPTPGAYAAPSPDPVLGVVEMDGLQYRYTQARDAKEHLVDQLSERDVVVKVPSTFFYDNAGKIVYIHTSDGGPPKNHEIELIRRTDGIAIIGKEFVTVMGFTFRHVGFAGITFLNGANNGIAIGNMSYGGHQGIQVYGSSNVTVYGNVLFRNENAGVYFAAQSHSGVAINNVAYENVKGARWGSQSSNGTAVDNVFFDNHERGISVEYSDHAILRRNRLVNNSQSQVLVIQSEYDSESNCFQTASPHQLMADFFFTDRYRTLAEYQQGKHKDLHSQEGNCGPLPEKVDVRKIHAETLAYAERARKILSGGPGEGTPSEGVAGFRSWFERLFGR